MSQQIHPIEATQRIRDDYIRYLRTIYFFRDEDLRRQFWQALDAPDFLVRGPILEASPPFRTGRSIAQLIAAGVLHPDFRQLCSPALPLDRPLYLHQDQAIEKVVAYGRNIVVATGTGSGKTEAFLIPIFDHLLRQRQTGVLAQPGVRALLLYPMNALANDQLKRLRQLLAHFPDITFGRYIGETEKEQKAAEERFYEQFPGELLLPNERISRKAMWDSPPHILITNYAMLEYLLLRPEDSPFFDGEAGQFWRFIVLDEAHTYDGAAGIEMAMLLRRVKDRVVRSESGRLRCIATSATLGRGRDDFPAVARFARELFGEPFEGIVDDPQRQDIIEGVREDMARLDAPWGEGNDALYAALAEAVAEGQAVPELAQRARTYGVPPEVVDRAQRAAKQADQDGQAVNRFLHAVLQGDEHLHRLRDILKDPCPLSKLATSDLGGQLTSDGLINLVRLAVRARRTPEAISLLPARYHVFARALEGAFVCLNQGHPAHAQGGNPRLFLKRYETCPHCQARVFELAACPRCGTVYIVGRETRDPAEDSFGRPTLRHPTATVEDPLGLSYFMLVPQAQQPDEDEAVIAGEALEEAVTGGLEPYLLCLQCGGVGPQADDRPCTCPHTSPLITLQRVTTPTDPLQHCMACGARSPNGIVYRFLTGRDAPVSVLAISLYQLLPPAEDERSNELPGQGRKLLLFSDSRQDAAFFAPYLERTYSQVLHRRLILKTLVEDEEGRAGHLRLQDLEQRVLQAAERAGLFTLGQSRDERLRLVRLWLTREFVALDTRISLEGLGLLQFRLTRPERWKPPPLLLTPPWNLSRDEVWNLLVVLLQTLRRQGVVTFPPNVDPRDPAFEPRNVELFMGNVADSQNKILGWMPKRGSNRRLDYLTRLLQKRAGLPKAEAEHNARQTLQRLWSYLTNSSSLWRTYLIAESRPRVGTLYHLDYRLWEWLPVLDETTPVYRCKRCFNVVAINLNGVCPTNGCDGELERVDNRTEAWEHNHYRRLYQTFVPIPLNAEEHTAQWTPQKASEVQGQFIRGEVNVLSCSTTFELGVDVGELQAVLMRNVPPTTANYVQRAGRAGRRTDSVAFVLTYAQRRSHDLIHFEKPERLVIGRVQPPVVVVSNEKIVRRHVHSVLLAAFFRWAMDHHSRSFSSVGAFFAPEDGGPSGPDLLRDYLNQRPLHVQEALARIVPVDLQGELDIAGWGWVDRLTNSKGDGLLDKVTQEVCGDLQLYDQLEQEAVRERKYNRAEHFKHVVQTVRGRDLLGFLGNRNVLPKYGFPTDVVELRTYHVPRPEAQQVDLQRDLRIALSEYAPGGEIIAAKRVWKSNGLYRLPGRDWETFYYAVCPACGRFYRSVQQVDRCCVVCGADLYGYPRRYGQLIRPEFGFLASRETGDPGERRPERIYASRVYFSEYVSETDGRQVQREPVLELSNKGIQVSYSYSRYGKLAVVNSGIGNAGFRICTACGWAEPAPVTVVGRRPRRDSGHENPRTRQPCQGRIETYHLGHEFITDVLGIYFTGPLVRAGQNDQWYSTLYALLEGASEALGIARDDLDGTLYPYQTGAAPALMLFDNVPGGAGHVRRIAEALPDVFKAAWGRVNRCECGEETSCYECLRNFSNQYVHDQLRRGLARKFLQAVIG